MFKMFEDTSGQNPKSHSTIRKITGRFYNLIYVVRFFFRILINQNCILETIKSRLNSVNVAIVQCRIFCLPVRYPKI